MIEKTQLLSSFVMFLRQSQDGHRSIVMRTLIRWSCRERYLNFLLDFMFIYKQIYDSEAKTESDGHTWREFSENGTNVHSTVLN